MSSTVNDRSAPASGWPQKVLLRVFLASIAVNALLGIWALLAGEFGETQGKVLATSLMVSAGMLSVLINGAPLQRRVLWPVPAVAAVAGAATFALFIVLMWAEVDSEDPLKLGFSGLVVAAGGTLAGLLALFRLRPEHAPVQLVTLGLIALLVVTVLVGIWGEIDGSWYGRTVGVESVLVAAFSLAVPVLWRFGARPEGPPSARVTGEKVTTIGELVSPYLISVEPTATLRVVVDHFIDGGVAFVVVEASHSVAGVISEHDVLRAIHDGADIDEVWAADIMTTDLVTAEPEASIVDAARLMTDHGVRHLLVVGDEGGVVSIRDVLAAMTPDPTDANAPT